MYSSGVAAYVAAFSLALLAVGSCQRSLSISWLKTDTESVSLSRRCVQGFCEEFPPPSYCFDHSSFCGGWRTCRFLLALSFILVVAVLLVLIFSVIFQRRKKTVFVVRDLLLASTLLQMVAIVAFPFVIDSSELFETQEWFWAGGYYMVLISATCQLFLVCEMTVFRDLVKHPDGDEIDSDLEDSYFDEDIETVSIDEDVPEDQIDFYLFNKRARRLLLNQPGR